MRIGLRKALALAMTAAAALFLTPAAAVAVEQQQPAVQGINPGTYQNLINNYHRKCLAVNSADNRNGKPLIHYDCYSSFTDQYWLFEPIAAAPGYYRLRNQNTGRCVAAANPSNGAKVVQYDCVDGYYDQWWLPELMPDNVHYRLRNYKSGRCLAVPSNQGQNGGNAVSYNCILGYNDQWWQIWP
ncbi:Ricin-type beta-trefoil lectin domain-like [Lentzea waywayandensis]|uniref:Ricin-type beta-trefoil lectin domain-like n=1 Tax=Lentzea waywayandensis TaxID=84724 RepID=A0A1I6CSZ0_9PSEU|nr:RICIN domain-containing protein [Lentzea waywayandensis]SFQ96251.1 Ricin-type beta-trefoil lectin domain-like [Lentzea waywayandensis]